MIACANVCSDMYAMGIYEIDNLLMILAASTDMNPTDRDIVTRAFIKGFDDQATAAGTIVSGGQTVLNPWPIIGGVAKSVVKMPDVIMYVVIDFSYPIMCITEW
jgi:selenide,water dikinase